MTFKLVKSRDQVQKIAMKVMEYLSKIADVGLPPQGVAGVRKVGGFRSEMDKKNKETLDKLTAERRAEFQSDADDELADELAEIDAAHETQVAAADKFLAAQEAKSAPWHLVALAAREQRRDDLRKAKGHSWLRITTRDRDKLADYWAKRRSEEKERRRSHMAQLEKKYREKRSYVEFSQRRMLDFRVNKQTEQARQGIRRRMGTFQWRIAFAIDTYEGKGYRGSTKLEKLNFEDPRKWEMVKEATAPPTK